MKVKRLSLWDLPQGGLGGVAKIHKKSSLTESLKTIPSVNEFLKTIITIDLLQKHQGKVIN